MRECPKCQVRNPDANRFCSNCGEPLQAGTRPVAPGPGVDQGKSTRLLDLAFQLSDEGRLADAIQVCQQAVIANPASTSAHSFLGILYERAGQREQAIREYEHALALSPESTADRESLQQLKAAQRGTRRSPVPRVVRYLVMAVLMALCLVIMAGIYYTLQPAGQGPAVAGVGDISRAPTLPTAPRQLPQPSAPPVMVVPPNPPEPAPAPSSPAPAAPAPAPVRPSVRVAPVTVPTPVPVVRPRPTPAALAPPAREEPKLAPPKALAEPAQVPSATAGSSLVEGARSYYFAKDYAGAIRAYQQALASDASAPAYVREELAWCYHQADRLREAKAEYRRALEAYLRELANGRNMAEATHGMSTCEAALRALENN